MLGMSADEIAPLKEAADRGAYEAVLRRALWADWLLRVQTRTQCVRPCTAAQALHDWCLSLHGMPDCTGDWGEPRLYFMEAWSNKRPTAAVMVQGVPGGVAAAQQHRLAEARQLCG